MKTITIDDNPAILELMNYIMQQIDPNGTHFFAETAMEGLAIIEHEGIRTVFLDMEMPGMSGEEAAHVLNDRYGRIDMIFITGHTEYAMLGHRLHCCAFVEKPFDEDDIREALKYLRLPAVTAPQIQVRCSDSFGVFVNGQPLRFVRSLTMEMFAYLIYKNGAPATNGELIGILWEGDADKQDYLRKHVKDLRDRLMEIGAENILLKSRGTVALDMSAIEVTGDPSALVEIYNWF